MIGFSATKNDIGNGNGKIEANDLVTKALNDPITDAEFDTARSAFAASLAKHNVIDLWLDIDTFGSGEPLAEIKAAETVTLAGVRAFTDKVKASPVASVLVNTQSPAN